MKEEYKATHYESDLTDNQWEKIEKYFPSGNKSKYHKINLVEAVLYIVKTGCQWRMLPHDYPPYNTVWSFYRRAKQDGTWEKICRELVKETRIQNGRNPEPSELVFIGFVRGFSSIILPRARQKSENILPYGELF